MEATVEDESLFETLSSPPQVRVTTNSPYYVVLFFALLALFFVASTRRGHPLGDDFTMYVHHAKNIAEGQSYGATGYLYNPGYPTIGPQTYPPVFPLLLAPVYRLVGLNFDALKMFSLAAMWLAVLLTYALWRRALGLAPLLALLALYAFNPIVCALKDNIISDPLFLCWLGLSFLLVQRVYEHNRLIVNQPVSAMLLGLTIYLAYGTRSIGLILLVCLVLYDLWHTRRLRALTLEIIGVTACLIALQTLFIHSDGGYADQLTITAHNVLANIKSYVSEFSAFWGGGYPRVLRYALFLVLLGLATWGWVICARQRLTFVAIFTVLYLLPILLVSLEIQLRYLVPLMPPLLFYALRGGQSWLARWPQPWPGLALASLVGVILLSYALIYRRADWQPYNEGVSRNETQQLASYVRQATTAEDVLVFVQPRTLALLTGRRVTAWHSPADEADLLSYLQKVQARYVIAGPQEVHPEKQAYLQQFIAHHAHRFQPLYANGAYRVYRFTMD